MVSQAYIDPLQIPAKNADIKYRIGFNDTGAWQWELGTPGLFTGTTSFGVPGAIQAGDPVAPDAAGRTYVDVPLSPYALSLVATGKYQVQPDIFGFTQAAETDEILYSILFLDGSGNFIGGRSIGSARSVYPTGAPALGLRWVPPETETIRVELNGFGGTYAQAFISNVKLALVEHPTNECCFIFGNRDSQAIVDTFTLVSGAGWFTAGSTWGGHRYPGIGMWQNNISIMQKDVLVSSLPAKAQTEIALGNAFLIVNFYGMGNAIMGSGMRAKTRVDCNNGETNLLSVGHSTYVEINSDGTAYNYSGNVPTTTDRFRVFYDGDKAGSGNNQFLVSNFYAVLSYPRA
jgi:hypothetical protein